jgi:uncharacterized protein DUF4255
MSDYTVLADIGESIATLLWNEMHVDPQVNALIDNQNRISLESPYDLRNNNAVRLSIYLYRIVEDAYTKNRFPVAGSGINLRQPPLTLDLFYLITPLVGAPREQQIVLGKVMQVFYDRAILSGADLVGALAGSDDVVRIMLNPVTLEETTRVWHALEMSYRLSMCYAARVALVDSTRERLNQPVVQRQSTFGEPATHA